MNKDFEIELKRKITIIDKYLMDCLNFLEPDVIWDAMRYSVNAGGKRLRPVILLAVCESLGGKVEDALPFACGLEFIHTYSLIHDDLPAMDDDDFRRGKPSNHKVFGDAVAILAGDGLLNLSYETMLGACVKNPAFTNAALEIASAAGVHGMIGGQTADILNENKIADHGTLLYIHLNKTAKLFRAAFAAGALIADADRDTVKTFSDIGEKLGLAFQILDDILDVTSNADKLGKPVNSDAQQNKNTYVTLFGLDESRREYERLSSTALAGLAGIPGSAIRNEFLLDLIKYMTKREM